VSDNKLPDFRKHDRDVRAIGTAAGLGFSLVATLVLLIGGGVWLDSWRDTAPVFTLIGVALGLIGAGYQLYELALLGRPDRENGPLGRALERRAASEPNDREPRTRN
jgi:hypothetical protein